MSVITIRLRRALHITLLAPCNLVVIVHSIYPTFRQVFGIQQHKTSCYPQRCLLPVSRTVGNLRAMRVMVADDRDWWHDVLGYIKRLWRGRL
jgi:hypothetical protein